ncbi:unnamed protein product [Cylindrotheca closterium]|uniref:Uncharacterized protein n=1 Tax=Cylindrotheca closterium TaxID=2856 RepID=A0AAD2FRP3_9STRA|nr:unnamed protein product [Cylindrotheca closterium]
MSSPPLQEYFTKLLKEQNVTMSSWEVRIVNDNARLSKASHARFSQTQPGLSMMSKNCKPCRWSPSPTITVHRVLDGHGKNSTNPSMATTAVVGDMINRQRTRRHLLISNNRWSASNVATSNPRFNGENHILSRSVSASLVVPNQD